MATLPDSTRTAKGSKVGKHRRRPRDTGVLSAEWSGPPDGEAPPKRGVYLATNRLSRDQRCRRDLPPLAFGHQIIRPREAIEAHPGLARRGAHHRERRMAHFIAPVRAECLVHRDNVV